MRFMSEVAHEELVAPLYTRLDDDVNELLARLVRGEGVGAGLLVRPWESALEWPAGDLHSAFAAVGDERLALAAAILWRLGHWAKDHWSHRGGGYWRFGAYADATLRELTGVRLWRHPRIQLHVLCGELFVWTPVPAAGEQPRPGVSVGLATVETCGALVASNLAAASQQATSAPSAEEWAGLAASVDGFAAARRAALRRTSPLVAAMLYPGDEFYEES